MDVRVTPIDRLLTIHKGTVMSIFLHFVHGRYRTARSWDLKWIGMVKWNGPSRLDRSNREKRSTSKGEPLFSKLFRLDLTDPFSFRPKFPEILVEWIAPYMYSKQQWPLYRKLTSCKPTEFLPEDLAIPDTQTNKPRR